MTKAQVILLIQQSIITNGNEEITADVLAPILEAMVNQPNDLIGVLTNLSTIDQTTLVAAINEVYQTAANNQGIVIHTGTADPNVTPPASFSITDYYHQVDTGINFLWQYNGTNWIKIE
ncbi:MAG TPA: hypothetical protein VFM82_05840 [Flavobacteriaceae bacterium]|nr:hypothetical protein [Flavobacteriaceae bacterium]